MLPQVNPPADASQTVPVYSAGDLSNSHDADRAWLFGDRIGLNGEAGRTVQSDVIGPWTLASRDGHNESHVC